MQHHHPHPHRLQKVGVAPNNSTSPIGSPTFLNVITKVDNTKGGTNKPSHFTITVSGKSPSPKSFSGSTSGTSVTLKAGSYNVIENPLPGYSIGSNIIWRITIGIHVIEILDSHVLLPSDFSNMNIIS